MRDRRVVATVLVFVFGVIAVASWLLQSGAEPEPAHAPQPVGSVPPAANAPPTSGAAPAEANTRQPSTEAAPPIAAQQQPRNRGLVLRVWLRGLHPDAKWTAPLHLDLDGRDATTRDRVNDDSAVVPDAEGRAGFVVPDWVATATEQDGRLFAHDPNYQPVEQRWDGAPTLGTELVLDVQVVANLTGRVIDSNSQPVPAARVTAFAMRDGRPIDQELARCNALDDGGWSMAAPPNVPLFLVATPMQHGGNRPSFRDLADTGAVRTDLLPVAAHAKGEVGTLVVVPDFVLPAATLLRGRVCWSDGDGIERALIQVLPRGGVVLGLGLPVADGSSAFRIGHRTFVEQSADGTLRPGARASTDSSGSFTLPTHAGTTVEVRLEGLHGMHLLSLPVATAVVPQPVVFALPRPIVLRAHHAGRPVAGAQIDIANGQTIATAADGTAAVVTSIDMRVRATRDALRSAWIDVPATAAGSTIELELLQERVPLQLEFDGDFRVRNTVVQWRRDDGEQGTEHLLRDDRSGPFELFLEPGRYHLTAGPGGGERNGVFLLPVERDVDLGGAPVALRLPATFGGTFTVTATDSSGLHVGGICRVRDATGADLSDRFELLDDGQRRQGKPAELLPGAVNHFRRILPPGDYVLELEFERHGARPQRVSIKPREVAEVRIRLP
jgi:hypothetical protein